MEVACRLKTLKMVVPAFQKIAISAKTNYYGTFCLFFLDSMNHGRYLSKYSTRLIEKMKSLNILICSEFEVKHLVNLIKKRGEYRWFGFTFCNKILVSSYI